MPTESRACTPPQQERVSLLWKASGTEGERGVSKLLHNLRRWMNRRRNKWLNCISNPSIFYTTLSNTNRGEPEPRAWKPGTRRQVSNASQGKHTPTKITAIHTLPVNRECLICMREKTKYLEKTWEEHANPAHKNKQQHPLMAQHANDIVFKTFPKNSAFPLETLSCGWGLSQQPYRNTIRRKNKAAQ